MESLIHLHNVSKHFKILNRRPGLSGAFKDLFSQNYKHIKAVDGVSLDIGAGEIVGFLGPNGAGKSTTIKMMTGVLSPTGGDILINGLNPFKDRIKYVRNIGVVFGQRTQLWWELPVLESFRLLKEIFAIPDATYKKNIQRFEDLVGLQNLYGQQVRNLSLGQRMLCDIAASFLHDPSIIFLDEPTIGLDVAVKAQIRNLIRQLNAEKGTTILLTTHDISDVEALCKRIVLIDKGRLIYDGATGDFNRIFGSYRTLRLQCKDGHAHTMKNLLPEVQTQFPIHSLDDSEADQLWYSITMDQDKVALSELMSWCLAKLPVADIKIQEISTESVIQRVYAGELPGAAATPPNSEGSNEAMGDAPAPETPTRGRRRSQGEAEPEASSGVCPSPHEQRSKGDSEAMGDAPGPETPRGRRRSQGEAEPEASSGVCPLTHEQRSKGKDAAIGDAPGPGATK